MTNKASDRPTCRGICVGSGKPCTRPIPARKPGMTRTKEQLYCHQHRNQAYGGHFGMRIDSNGHYTTIDSDETEPESEPEAESDAEQDDLPTASVANSSEDAALAALTDQLGGMGISTQSSAVDSLLDGFNNLSVTGSASKQTDDTSSKHTPKLTMPMPANVEAPLASGHVESALKIGPSPIGFDPRFLYRRMQQGLAEMMTIIRPSSVTNLEDKPLPPLPHESDEPVEQSTETHVNASVQPVQTNIVQPVTPSKPQKSHKSTPIASASNQSTGVVEKLGTESPFAPPKPNQCRGFVKATGLRCRRIVKNPKDGQYYCFSHKDQAPSGQTAVTTVASAPPQVLMTVTDRLQRKSSIL
jgi:hypothetical protein